MTGLASALYLGRVIHRRFRPRVHKLDYRVFWMVLDLDELDELTQTLRVFSRNRFNLFSFHDRDYGDRSTRPLKAQIEAHLGSEGISLDGGSIRLLTMPRILGYAFNPLSVYFCYRRSGALAAILFEVSNTFGERHSYLIRVNGSDMRPIRQRIAKSFYVSPFLDMDMAYDFRIVPPGETVMVAVGGRDAEGPMINALLQGARAELTDRALIRAFVVYPLLTLKVVAGIHWEALLLWLKGIGLRRRPPPPKVPVSSPHTVPKTDRAA